MIKRKDRVKKAEEVLRKTMREDIARQHRIEEILNELYKQPLFFGYLNNKRKTKIEFNVYPDGSDITVRSYEIEPERIIEELAGPLHRKFNLYWKMTVIGETGIRLHGKYQPYNLLIDVYFDIYLPKSSPCKIIETDIEYYTPSPSRKLKLVCG